MIQDVKSKRLSQFNSPQGRVMHMLRNDSPNYTQFGEIYFSTINPNAIKAWRRHKVMTANITVIIGEVRIILFDDRKTSRSFGKFQEFILSQQNYHLVTIPPNIWTGFQSIDINESIIANLASIPHDPNEMERLDYNSSLIPYRWRGNEK